MGKKVFAMVLTTLFLFGSIAFAGSADSQSAETKEKVEQASASEKIPGPPEAYSDQKKDVVNPEAAPSDEDASTQASEEKVSDATEKAPQ